MYGQQDKLTIAFNRIPHRGHIKCSPSGGGAGKLEQQADALPKS
jgi:hypothetical protein